MAYTIIISMTYNTMDMLKQLRVSIVIPAYNEAGHLRACLDAIAQQSVRPYEVIVVDNNSIDQSVRIAQAYDFVTVVQEKRQGVVHARNSGFNAATGDIIGRIDADTIIGTDWVKQIQSLFADRNLDAVSGSVSYHDLPWEVFISGLDLAFRSWIARGMGREVFLFGSNMAIRRSAWLRVRSKVCNEQGMHEDFDLAIHLHSIDCTVTFDQQLKAAVSLRRFNTGLSEYWKYVWLSPETYRMHGRVSHRRMYPVVALVVSHHWLIKLLLLSYNPHNQTVTLNNLWLERSPVRVNPATFVE